jgi:hypothetical protein
MPKEKKQLLFIYTLFISFIKIQQMHITCYVNSK